MDFEYLDNFIDAVFVINKNREIVYCNEAAATMSESSVRRLTKNKLIYDVIKFNSEELIVVENGQVGFESMVPFTEITYKVIKSNNEGRVQVLVQPVKDGCHWMVIAHDVTLEEQLQKKYLLELNQKEDVIVDLKSAKKELEHYSKNLESMVEERTAEVKKANIMLSAIMNSLGQGFVVFDSNGLCGEIYTKACEDILEINPAHQKICDVLKLEGDERDQAQKWMTTVFSEVLPFDTLKDLGPTEFKHSQDKYVIIDYYPIRNEKKSIENVVLVATDKTSEQRAGLLAEKEKQYSNMVIRLVKNKEQFSQFLETAHKRLAYLKVLFMSEENFDYEESFRILHTLEGESGVFGCSELSLSAKDCQNVLGKLKSDDKCYADIREELMDSRNVMSKTFKKFMKTNGELFKKLKVLEGRIVEIKETEVKSFYTFLKNQSTTNEKILYEFEETFLKEPIEKHLIHLDQLAEKVAERIGKKLKPLEVIGGDIKIYSSRFKSLLSSFVHSIRNAIDHGIEYPEKRLDIGKSEEGSISIACEKILEKGQLSLRIVLMDDGAGIDPEIIREKMYKKTKDESILEESEEDVIQHIFDAGFSSRDNVSEFSGRGVGMDALKNEVQLLNGEIRVYSKQGKGTRVVITVPYVEEMEKLKLSA